ncbi:hypothetical protein Sjap_010916 [Stephania japonica]|uniref:KIB1-4 beta-propeller domain-containing protein n=1 Tax=Stephania japonica TaxID=461633 RepID=A0AAP0JAJ1_9MAGN
MVVMRLGDEKWTSIEIESFPSLSALATTWIHDLAFYKGKLYFVNQSGMVLVCDENVHTPRNHDDQYCHPMKAITLTDPIDIDRYNKYAEANTRCKGGDVLLGLVSSIMDNKHKHKHKHAPEFTENVLHIIVRWLSSLVCFAAFGSVFKSWRSFFLQYYSYLVPPSPPWLILPDPNSTDCSQPITVYGLYGFEDRKLFDKCNIPSNCPFIKNYKDVLVGAVHNSNNFVFMRLGDEKWTTVEIESFPSRSLIITRIVDLLFYKGKFYLVNQSGTVFVCEENVHAPRNHDYHYSHPIKAIKLTDHVDITSMSEPIVNASIDMHFLVEVKGELMLVIKFLLISNTHYFRVFKFDFTKEHGLKGCSLFLNYCNGSMAAREVSGRTKIYFKFYDMAYKEGQEDLRNHKLMVSDLLGKGTDLF